jgi:hypothetical protein
LPRYVKEESINTRRRRETLLPNQLSPSLKEGCDTFLKPLKGWMLWMDGGIDGCMPPHFSSTSMILILHFHL